MSSKRRGLGKGLGALIPGADSAAGLAVIQVRDIAPNPWQPRQEMREEDLQELANSIREHGLLQPLIVTTAPIPASAPGPHYQLVAGERRWRASMLAGLETVPALIKEATPQQVLEMALVENIQRADLNALEEAQAYQQLVDEFGMTQDAVAERVGKSRVAVTNALRLLRLPIEVKQALQEGRISEGHARALLGLPDAALQLQAMGMIESRSLSVRQTEALVRQLVSAPQPAAEQPPARTPDAEQGRLEDRFRQVLGTKVSLHRGKGGGRLVIYFYSEEELQAICDRIVGEESL